MKMKEHFYTARWVLKNGNYVEAKDDANILVKFKSAQQVEDYLRENINTQKSLNPEIIEGVIVKWYSMYNYIDKKAELYWEESTKIKHKENWAVA